VLKEQNLPTENLLLKLNQRMTQANEFDQLLMDAKTIKSVQAELDECE
jgi:hypothetical protein